MTIRVALLGVRMGQGSSIDRNAACLDRPRPFVDLARDEFGEIFRASAFDGGDILTNGFEPFADKRQIQGGTQRLAEAMNDWFGSVSGQE